MEDDDGGLDGNDEDGDGDGDDDGDDWSRMVMMTGVKVYSW